MQYEAAESLLESATSRRLANDPSAVVALATTRIGSEKFQQALAGIQSAADESLLSERPEPKSIVDEFLPVVQAVSVGPKALLVGIDEGPSREASKSFVVAARWITNVLGFAKNDTRILLNNDATGPRIKEDFENLAKASLYRTGIFFYAGPGVESSLAS